MFKYEYLWIIVLVLAFEAVALIPFKKHLLHDGESIFFCVFIGNFTGVILGAVAMTIIGLILGSFCEFRGIVDYKEAITNILDIGVVVSSFIGYIVALTSEWC